MFYTKRQTVCADNGGRKLPSQMAFTLIELLVVIAVIAILAALLTAESLEQEAKSRQNQRSAKSNLHELTLAIAFYVQDNNSAY